MTKWVLFAPELVYVLMAAVLFWLSLQKRVDQKRVYAVALFFAAAGVVATLICVNMQGMVFFDAYRVDLFSQLFKLLIAIGTMLVIFSCSELNGIDGRQHPEFFMFLSVCTLGMMMLVSSVELLTIYVSIELSSYSLYLVANMRRNAPEYSETGIKYFMVGVTASAFMLFGLSYLFGVTHTTYVAELSKVLPTVIKEPAAIIGRSEEHTSELQSH